MRDHNEHLDDLERRVQVLEKLNALPVAAAQILASTNTSASDAEFPEWSYCFNVRGRVIVGVDNPTADDLAQMFNNEMQNANIDGNCTQVDCCDDQDSSANQALQKFNKEKFTNQDSSASSAGVGSESKSASEVTET